MTCKMEGEAGDAGIRDILARSSCSEIRACSRESITRDLDERRLRENVLLASSRPRSSRGTGAQNSRATCGARELDKKTLESLSGLKRIPKVAEIVYETDDSESDVLRQKDDNRTSWATGDTPRVGDLPIELVWTVWVEEGQATEGPSRGLRHAHIPRPPDSDDLAGGGVNIAAVNYSTRGTHWWLDSKWISYCNGYQYTFLTVSWRRAGHINVAFTVHMGIQLVDSYNPSWKIQLASTW
ncbi:hypothetical protein B0H11DRAFT_1924546 [Mycena galericulata]|nr:hypothetical protein B0H11DRAFT_1924546 [Mycena galericulata]